MLIPLAAAAACIVILGFLIGRIMDNLGSLNGGSTEVNGERPGNARPPSHSTYYRFSATE